MRKVGILVLGLVAGAVLALRLHAQEANRPPIPLSYRNWLQLKDKPGAISGLGANLPPVAAEGGPRPALPLKDLSQLKAMDPISALNELKESNVLGRLELPETVQGLKPSPFTREGAPAQLWSNLTNIPPGGPYNVGNPLLMTDGTVIVHRTASPEWYKLTPDKSGSYVNGNWSQIASMPPNYGPMYFASAVLPDGRVVAEGGEYNLGQQVFTSMGAIYDPTSGPKGAWTAMSPPAGWNQIGDGQSAILSNGTFMVADCCEGPPFRAALLNPSDLTWRSTGTDKADMYDEEAWSLLPDATVLTVDAYTTAINGTACGLDTERYDPSTGAWSNAGKVPSQLADCNAANAAGGSNPSFEIGPQVLMYNGKVITFGGTTGNVAHTALYDTTTKKWTAGPDLPISCGFNGKSPCTLADAPAVLLPSGNVLFVASAGLYQAPANFFEYDPTANKIAPVPGTADANKIPSYYVNFLALPTGQILAIENMTSTIQIYSPSGAVQESLRPVVTSSLSCVARGGSYVVQGNQLNGLSQAANYGDDQQAATNYPLVRIVNRSTGHVFYARTSGHSTMTVARNARGSTHFSVSPETETGASTLYVVANGIPSAGSPVTVAASTCPSAAANP